MLTFKRYQGRILGLVGCSVVLALFTALYGALTGPLLKAIFGGRELQWPASVMPFLPAPPPMASLRQAIPYALVLCALLKGLSVNRFRVWQAKLVAEITKDLRLRLYTHVMRFSPSIMASRGVANLSSRLILDVDAVARMVGDGFVVIIRDGLQVVCLASVCLMIDWKMTLVVFVVYPLAFFPLVLLGRRLRAAAMRSQESRTGLSEVIDADFRRSHVLQLASAPQMVAARFDLVNDGAAKATVKAVRVAAWSSPVAEVLGAVALAIGVALTIERVTTATIAPEHVMSFLAAVLLLYQPAKALGRVQATIETGRAALLRIDEVLSDSCLIPQRRGTSPSTQVSLIELRNVSFKHNEVVILDDLTCRFELGQANYLAGPNGSGKSTIASLIANLHEPSAGGVFVDQRPLESFESNAWRRMVGWVPQDTLLVGDTLRTAMVFGNCEVDTDELDQVAVRCQLSDMIRERGGWDAPIGDESRSLSGGERQRLAICRALLARPAVLILDEPTSHLDSDGVLAMAALLERLASETLLIVITHDGRLLEGAKHIVRLSGRLLSGSFGDDR